MLIIAAVLALMVVLFLPKDLTPVQIALDGLVTQV
jgi:hypothetical protein